MRTFVIGDIHGAYKALLQCFERSGFNRIKDRLIVIGDVCDGYPEVRQCIDELLKVKHCDLVIGNHDMWALDWAVRGDKPEIWTSQGGNQTIASYGGAPIIVSIFDDRVEVRNPGKLLPGLNIKKLEGNHATRNEAVCNIFHETMDMERFGTGISKMKKQMKEHGLSAPEFSEEGDFFVVKFYGPGDKILDLVPSIPEHRQTDLKKLGLNERQINALRLMVNEKMVLSNELYQEINKVSRRTAVRDLRGLVELGQVKVKGVGKGTKYKA